MSSNVGSVVGSIIDRGVRANFKSSLDCGRVVDQELEGDQSWFFFTSTEKEASPMAEILPETEPRSVVSLNRRLCGWEASASDETATLKHATNRVPMNRATRVAWRGSAFLFPEMTSGWCGKGGTNYSTATALGTFVSEIA
jgi:hypothetical protein